MDNNDNQVIILLFAWCVLISNYGDCLVDDVSHDATTYDCHTCVYVHACLGPCFIENILNIDVMALLNVFPFLLIVSFLLSSSYIFYCFFIICVYICVYICLVHKGPCFMSMVSRQICTSLS